MCIEVLQECGSPFRLVPFSTPLVHLNPKRWGSNRRAILRHLHLLWLSGSHYFGYGSRTVGDREKVFQVNVRLYANYASVTATLMTRPVEVRVCIYLTTDFLFTHITRKPFDRFQLDFSHSSTVRNLLGGTGTKLCTKYGDARIQGCDILSLQWLFFVAVVLL